MNPPRGIVWRSAVAANPEAQEEDVYYTLADLKQRMDSAANRGREFNLVSLRIAGHDPNRKQIILPDGRTKVWAFNAEYLREALSKSLDEGRIFSIFELSSSPHTDPPRRIFVPPNLMVPREERLERTRAADEEFARRLNAERALRPIFPTAPNTVAARVAPPPPRLPNHQFPARPTNAPDIQTADCLVCMEVMNPVDQTPPGVQCRRCSKPFHIPCIAQWLQLSARAGCPHCREGRV